MTDPKKNPLAVFAKALALTLGVLLLWYAKDIFLLGFAAALLAVFLTHLSRWVQQKTTIPYLWAYTLVLVGLTAASVGLGLLLAPEVRDQVNELAETLPKSIEPLRERITRERWLKPFLPTGSSSSEGSKAAVSAAGSVLGVSVQTVAALVVILFAGVFLAADPRRYMEGFLSLIPTSRRSRARKLLEEISGSLSTWLLTRLFVMAVLAVLTTIGLWVLKIPMALTLGLLAGVLLFIPYVGAVASAVPALLLASTQSLSSVLYVGLLYVVTHVLEGYVLTPIVQNKALELPPAWTLLFQVLMEAIAGIGGVALSTPLLVVLQVAVQRLYIDEREK